MRRLCTFLVVLTLVLGGCSGEDKIVHPEQPPGTPVELAESDQGPPNVENPTESQRWVTKAIQMRLAEAPEKALYCLHQAEETYTPPSDEALEKFPVLKQPIDPWIAKLHLYSWMGKTDLAAHYQQLLEGKELPPWGQYFYQIGKAQLLHVQGRHQEVASVTKDAKDSYSQVLLHASRVVLEEPGAHPELVKAWAALKKDNPNAYKLAPPSVRDLVNKPPASK